MTDLEAIASFVNEGELFSVARLVNRNKLRTKDVYYIESLGKPSGHRIDYLYRVLAHTNKRLIVSGIEEIDRWIPYFNRCSVDFMEVDDDTVLFMKDV